MGSGLYLFCAAGLREPGTGIIRAGPGIRKSAGSLWRMSGKSRSSGNFLKRDFKKSISLKMRMCRHSARRFCPGWKKCARWSERIFSRRRTFRRRRLLSCIWTTPQRDMIACRVFGVYGEKKYNLYADAASGTRRRGQGSAAGADGQRRVETVFPRL